MMRDTSALLTHLAVQEVLAESCVLGVCVDFDEKLEYEGWRDPFGDVVVDGEDVEEVLDEPFGVLEHVFHQK
jgi:hypothetical protein